MFICPKCGHIKVAEQPFCHKCMGKRPKTDEIEKQRVWENHYRLCPVCGVNPMWHESVACFSCSGLTHPTPEQEKERLRKKSKRGYEKHKEARLDYAHKRYVAKSDEIMEQHKDYLRRNPDKRIQTKESPLLKENRKYLLTTTNTPCKVCGGYDRREVDHVILRSQGGSDELDNLQVLCFKHHRGAGTGKHSAWSIEE